MDFKTGYQNGFLARTTDHWLLSSNAKLYGSGRAAFVDISRTLKMAGYETLWVPAWICNELVISLLSAGHLQIRFYGLNADLTPTAPFLKQLNPRADALLVVDYFASLNGDVILKAIDEFRGPILIDAVHSWLLSDLSRKLSDRVTLVSGFRKLFWKIGGAIVTGNIADQLPKLPTLISQASPGFPRNLTLSPRHGLLSKQVLSLNQLNRFDHIADSWSTDAKRGILSQLKSPVKLEKYRVSYGGSQEWFWPDLFNQLDEKMKEHAELLRQQYRVVWR